MGNEHLNPQMCNFMYILKIIMAHLLAFNVQLGNPVYKRKLFKIVVQAILMDNKQH